MLLTTDCHAPSSSPRHKKCSAARVCVHMLCGEECVCVCVVRGEVGGSDSAATRTARCTEAWSTCRRSTYTNAQKSNLVSLIITVKMLSRWCDG